MMTMMADHLLESFLNNMIISIILTKDIAMRRNTVMGSKLNSTESGVEKHDRCFLWQRKVYYN